MPSRPQAENWGPATRKVQALGLPTKDHNANPGRWGCRRRQSRAKPESHLRGLVGNELRNQTPRRQTGPACPPLPQETFPPESPPAPPHHHLLQLSLPAAGRGGSDAPEVLGATWSLSGLGKLEEAVIARGQKLGLHPV